MSAAAVSPRASRWSWRTCWRKGGRSSGAKGRNQASITQERRFTKVRPEMRCSARSARSDMEDVHAAAACASRSFSKGSASAQARAAMSTAEGVARIIDAHDAVIIGFFYDMGPVERNRGEDCSMRPTTMCRQLVLDTAPSPSPTPSSVAALWQPQQLDLAIAKEPSARQSREKESPSVRFVLTFALTAALF